METSALIELADSPGLWLATRRHETFDGFALVSAGPRASVEELRLRDVEAAVEQVRQLARERGLTEVAWWVGSTSEPADLADRLLELGFEPDPVQALLTNMTIDRRPGGEAAAEVRRVETFEDFVLWDRISSSVWDHAPEVAESARARLRETWESARTDERRADFLGFVGGEAVGFGRVVFAPRTGLLLGGGVLPGHRGRGVYTSLVLARWDEAVARGIPSLTVGAGSMSAPILARLGFRSLSEIRILVDASIGSRHGDDRIG